MIADLAGCHISAIWTISEIPSLSRHRQGYVEQIGFDEQDTLFPRDTRVFRGSELLREYFCISSQIPGRIKLTKLEAVIPRLRNKNVEIIFAFDDISPRLSAAVQPGFFALYSAPAINLFEKTADRILLKVP